MYVEPALAFAFILILSVAVCEAIEEVISRFKK